MQTSILDMMPTTPEDIKEFHVKIVDLLNEIRKYTRSLKATRNLDRKTHHSIQAFTSVIEQAEIVLDRLWEIEHKNGKYLPNRKITPEIAQAAPSKDAFFPHAANFSIFCANDINQLDIISFTEKHFDKNVKQVVGHTTFVVSVDDVDEKDQSYVFRVLYSEGADPITKNKLIRRSFYNMAEITNVRRMKWRNEKLRGTSAAVDAVLLTSDDFCMFEENFNGS